VSPTREIFAIVLVEPSAVEGVLGFLLSTLAIVAACGIVGGLIDFCIKKAGQQRVRSCLETWWLKLSYVRWGNFGREEALFAIRVMDRIFGSRLFSIKRMIVVVVAVLACGGFIVGQQLMVGRIGLMRLHALYAGANLLWIIIILFLLTASFSLTRLFSILVVSYCPQHVISQILGVLGILAFQFLLLCYWMPLINLVRLGIAFAYDGTLPFSFSTFVTTMWDNTKIILNTLAPAFLETRPIIGPIFEPFMAGTDDTEPHVFMWHMSALVTLIPAFIRIMLMMLFIVSFLFRPIQHLIMALLERIVESEKPVFTLVFGSAAAIAKAIQEIAKNVL